MREMYTRVPQNQDTARYRREYAALIEMLEEEMRLILQGYAPLQKIAE
jgi:hypothetical protein